MCEICGCGAPGAYMAGGDGARPSDEGVVFRVVEPGVRTSNYVLPGALTHEREAGQPRPNMAVADQALVGTDGRAARADVPGEQAPYGWGFAKAVPGPGETADGLLTVLPTDPVGFSQREQDDVRRDLGDQVGDYYAYVPTPFAGQDPLTGQYQQGFGSQATDFNGLQGARKVIG